MCLHSLYRFIEPLNSSIARSRSNVTWKQENCVPKSIRDNRVSFIFNLAIVFIVGLVGNILTLAAFLYAWIYRNSFPGVLTAHLHCILGHPKEDGNLLHPLLARLLHHHLPHHLRRRGFWTLALLSWIPVKIPVISTIDVVIIHDRTVVTLRRNGLQVKQNLPIKVI